MNEEWKNVVGYEGKYEVSNLGNIRNYNTKQVLRVRADKYGYLRINLRTGKANCKTRFIHQLVAEAFCDNPNQCISVNHIDANKKNNCAKNLEWCTQKENMQHAVALNLISYNNRKNKFKKTPVIGTNCITGERFLFESIKQAAIFVGRNSSKISGVLKGEHHTTANYFWEYA